MEKFLLFLLYSIIFKTIIGQNQNLKFKSLYPNSIKVSKKLLIPPTISIEFEELLTNENSNLILEYSGDKTKNISLKKTSQEKNTLNFNFNPIEDFYNKNCNIGKYKVYYNSEEIGEILIYENEIILMNPKNRYFLDDSNENIQIQFELQDTIIKEQINNITYYEKSKEDDKKNLTNYYLDDEGKTLYFNFSGEKEVKTYIFNIYPATIEGTTDNYKFTIYFQDFLVYNEAVYANKTADSAKILFKIKFKDNKYNQEKFLIEFNEKKIQNGNFEKNGTNTYNYNFNIPFKPSAGNISIQFTNDNNEVQIRPIFLITYETENNKCYLTGTTGNFIIIFSKTKEMQYTHFVYFDTGSNIFLTNIDDYNSDEIQYYVPLSLFKKSGTFNLYSIIPNLSSNSSNPIDIPSLYIRIFEDPKLEDDNTTYLYTDINTKQSIIFNMTGAGSVNEIFLISQNREPIEILGKSDFNCTNNNNIFNCNFNYLDNNYIGRYNVSYTCECDNKRLTIDKKHIIIEKGILLISINRKWCFIDETDKERVTLTYSFNDLNDINISFCDKTYTKCSNRSIVEHFGQSAMVNLSGLSIGTYYIKTIKNEQTIINNKIIFKVLDHLDFSFNHRYFVKGKTIQGNNLIINKNFSDSKICKIRCEQNQNYEIKGNNNCTNFSYEINNTPLGVNTFRYYDEDINEYIPIDKNITVVAIIDDLIDFNNMKGCYYFNFSITGFIKPIKKFKERLFLLNNDSKEEIEFDKKEQGNNIEYTLNETNNQKIFELIGKPLDLYISEESKDTVVYLYKTKVTFTKINVPEYLIKPNKTIYFSGLSCNICDSSFLMQFSSFVYPIRVNCKYSNNDNSMTIDAAYDFNMYNYYNYIVDNHYINANLTSTNPLSTFVSNSLNESYFQITSNEKNSTSYNITITNTKRDFYFKLISNLTLFKIINGKNNTKITLDKKSSGYDFSISETEYTISFIIEKGNFDLDVNHITREVKSWEGNQGNRIYYFFKNNNIFNFTIFRVSPTVFASHALTSKKYIISINFVNKDLLNSFESNAKSICSEYNIPEDTNNIICTLNVSVSENKSQTIEKNISTYPIIIDLIYFDLISSKCVTLKDEDYELKFNIYVPKISYLDEIYLLGNDYQRTGTKENEKTINYLLKIKNMQNIEYPYSITDYNDLYETFYLKDFDVKFIPKYDFLEKDKIIFLLPENKQEIKLTFTGYSKEDLQNIISFQIESIISTEFNIGEDNIILKFNLRNITTSKNSFDLFYKDKCNTTIKTDIIIEIISFHFTRHYFILNNNNNQQNGQTLQIFCPKIPLYIIEEKNENSPIPITDYDSNHFNYVLKDEGTYGFYYVNNGNNYNISDKVHVYQEFSQLFKNNTNYSECMFLDTKKNLQFNYTFQEGQKKYSDSSFNMVFKNDNDEYSLTNLSDSNNIRFSLSYEGKGNIISNKSLLIYFFENNDMKQPLYLYKYRYTNITLNSIYKDVIYSDAKYLMFNMYCNISNLKSFNIYKQNSEINQGEIKCLKIEYEEEKNIVKCELNKNYNFNNPFINRKLDYGYYYFKYDSSDLVTEKDFYFSKEIETTDFKIEKENYIYTFSDTNIKINSSNNEFYMPYLDNITFINCSGIDCANKENINRPVTFNGDFPVNNNISITLYIAGKSQYYNMSQICRKTCLYCNNTNCKKLNPTVDYNIASNIPDIIFDFKRLYISLSDSYYNSYKNSNIIYTISGEEKEKLDNIVSSICTNLSYCVNNSITTFDLENENTLSINQPGMYIFYFKSKINDNHFPVKQKIFVVNNDYELLNLYDLNKNCLYYSDGVLFTAITINESYIFKDNASNALNDLSIFYGKSIFNYANKNSGYTLSHDYDYIFNCDPGKPFNYSIIENHNDKIVFTQRASKKNCTTLAFEDYFYKDNIIFWQTCGLDNMFLNEKDAHISDGVLLNCEFDRSENKSYCNIQKDFKIPMYDYNLYFKYEDYLLNTNQRFHIYNSINDSKFDIDYKNPNLSIISSNFDMNNLSEVYIDNRNYNTSFNIVTTNQISFNYLINLNDTSIHYLTKLLRRNKTNDRINTIKHKDLRIEIKEIECPQFQKAYLSKCWYCSDLIKLGEYPEEKKWYQDGECVEKCNFTADYGIFDQYNFYCQQCKGGTLMNDNEGNTIYLCSCLEGTVKSLENDVCYLPEMDEITKLTNIQKNTQCYKADGVSHNYCKQNKTKSCAVETINGYFFPICNCQDEYIGKYCEFDKGNFSLINNLNDILSDNNIINEANITIIAKVRGITHFLEIESDTYIQQFNDTSMSIYIDSSIRIIDNIINSGKKTFPQIFDVVELAIFFLNHRITNNKKLRNLQETENDINRLNYLLNNLHYVYVQANLNSKQNYKIQTDKLNLTTFIVYKKGALADESFKLEMANLSFFKIMEYIDLNNKTEDDDLIFITLINSSLFKNDLQSSEDFGVRAYFSTSHDIDITTNQNNSNIIDTVNNFTFYISSSVIHFNFYLAEYYFNRNIKIYDKNDKAFVEPCFLSEDFDFDLTQKYRKNNVFQKMNYGNEYCKYVNFEYKYKRLNFICQGFSNYNSTNDLRYAMLNFNIQKESISDANKVYNLPTKCTKKIKSVGSNWAFWFFLIICILELIYCIGIGFLTFGSLRNISFRKGLVLDEFYQIIPFRKDKNEDSISNSVQLPKYKEKEEQKNKRNNYNYSDDESNNNNSIITTEEESFNKSFVTCFLHNLKELHPLSTLCRVSVLSPLVLNSIIFVFNTLVLFGFNALLYYESLIEKRIYNKKRNNFDYPMLKEFHKIILSILCQIVLCILIKFIHLVTLKQRNELKNNLRTCYIDRYNSINNKIIAKIQDFQDEMFLRRIISSCVMVIIVTFFFYYSVAFCAVYIQTQRNWFFSGIWALFWNWVILAPIFIGIISFIEYKKKDLNDSTVYYMKRLFCF